MGAHLRKSFANKRLSVSSSRFRWIHKKGTHLLLTLLLYVPIRKELVFVPVSSACIDKTSTPRYIHKNFTQHASALHVPGSRLMQIFDDEILRIIVLLTYLFTSTYIILSLLITRWILFTSLKTKKIYVLEITKTVSLTDFSIKHQHIDYLRNATTHEIYTMIDNSSITDRIAPIIIVCVVFSSPKLRNFTREFSTRVNIILHADYYLEITCCMEKFTLWTSQHRTPIIYAHLPSDTRRLFWEFMAHIYVRVRI